MTGRVVFAGKSSALIGKGYQDIAYALLIIIPPSCLLVVTAEVELTYESS